MADIIKILGQTDVAAITNTTLYTVPSTPLSKAMVSSIVVCNRSTSPITFRVSIVPSGGAVGVNYYIYYDVPLGGSDTFVATLGIGLGAGDFISVYSSSSDTTFSAFGVEIV